MAVNTRRRAVGQKNFSGILNGGAGHGTDASQSESGKRQTPAKPLVGRHPKRRERRVEIESPLSTREVASMLNVHANTVRRWSNQGILKTYRVGPRGDRRFKRKDVQDLIKEHKRTVSDE